MAPDDIDDLVPSRRGAVLYVPLLLLLILVVTWCLFSPAFSYVRMDDNAAHLTGKVEGPATLGQAAFDKPLAPVMQALGCHDVSFNDASGAAHRVPLCLFSFGGLPAGASVKLLYGDDETAVDDASVAIRAGVAGSFWLNFSIFVFYRIRR
jgi:hypothetical protein